jgi:hypothetical protein
LTVLTLHPVLDLRDAIAGRSVVATGVGAWNELAVLVADVMPEAPVRAGQSRVPGSGSHDPTVVLRAALIGNLKTQAIREVTLAPISVPYPSVQPLADGGILVADSRVAVGRPPNGHVFGPDGAIRRSILFGDGIGPMLVDDRDRAWVGYFDEGVYGNLGWNASGGPAPIGQWGLVRFDLEAGVVDWEFTPPKGGEPIDDCYALNLDGSGAWTCYYASFDLVRIYPDDSSERWPYGRSVSALACDESRTLLAHGSAATLVRRAPGELLDPEPVDLELDGVGAWDSIVGRGSRLHAIHDNTWFVGDLASVP